MIRIVSLSIAFAFMAGCNNEAGNYQQGKETADSAPEREVNYVMENNVKQEVKKKPVADSAEIPNNTMVADTTAYVIIDTVRK